MGRLEGVVTWVRRVRALHVTKLRYVVNCVVIVAGFRLGLTLLPSTTLRRLVRGLPSGAVPSSPNNPDSAHQVRWGVARAARLVPCASCLTQALAVEFLLTRRGLAAEIRIGVAKGDDGRLCAHAWVTSGGRVVIGGPLGALERYTPLTAAGSTGS
jgi:hypothetical protein